MKIGGLALTNPDQTEVLGDRLAERLLKAFDNSPETPTISLAGSVMVSLEPTDTPLANDTARRCRHRARFRDNPVWLWQPPVPNGSGHLGTMEIREIKDKRVLIITRVLTDRLIPAAESFAETIKRAGGVVLGVGTVRSEVDKDVRLPFTVHSVE